MKLYNAVEVLGEYTEATQTVGYSSRRRAETTVATSAVVTSQREGCFLKFRKRCQG
jgi:hypothetical protein